MQTHEPQALDEILVGAPDQLGRRQAIHQQEQTGRTRIVDQGESLVGVRRRHRQYGHAVKEQVAGDGTVSRTSSGVAAWAASSNAARPLENRARSTAPSGPVLNGVGNAAVGGQDQRELEAEIVVEERPDLVVVVAPIDVHLGMRISVGSSQLAYSVTTRRIKSCRLSSMASTRRREPR